MRERRDDDVILTMTNFLQITLLPTERLIFTLYDNSANILKLIMIFFINLSLITKDKNNYNIHDEFIKHANAEVAVSTIV